MLEGKQNRERVEVPLEEVMLAAPAGGGGAAAARALAASRPAAEFLPSPPSSGEPYGRGQAQGQAWASGASRRGSRHSGTEDLVASSASRVVSNEATTQSLTTGRSMSAVDILQSLTEAVSNEAITQRPTAADSAKRIDAPRTVPTVPEPQNNGRARQKLGDALINCLDNGTLPDHLRAVSARPPIDYHGIRQKMGSALFNCLESGTLHDHISAVSKPRTQSIVSGTRHRVGTALLNCLESGTLHDHMTASIQAVREDPQPSSKIMADPQGSSPASGSQGHCAPASGSPAHCVPEAEEDAILKQAATAVLRSLEDGNFESHVLEVLKEGQQLEAETGPLRDDAASLMWTSFQDGNLERPVLEMLSGRDKLEELSKADHVGSSEARIDMIRDHAALRLRKSFQDGQLDTHLVEILNEGHPLPDTAPALSQSFPDSAPPLPQSFPDATPPVPQAFPTTTDKREEKEEEEQEEVEQEEKEDTSRMHMEEESVTRSWSPVDEHQVQAAIDRLSGLISTPIVNTPPEQVEAENHFVAVEAPKKRKSSGTKRVSWAAEIEQKKAEDKACNTESLSLAEEVKKAIGEAMEFKNLSSDDVLRVLEDERKALAIHQVVPKPQKAKVSEGAVSLDTVTALLEKRRMLREEAMKLFKA